MMFPATRSPRVVGIGEILWDLLPDGKQPGGAPANFAFHAHSLGARTALVSAVGDDALGRDILGRLDGWGIDRRTVAVLPGHPTGTVSVTVDDHGVPRYVIHEDVVWDHIPWSPSLEELAAAADAVCFGTLCRRAPESREAIRRFLAATPARCLRVCDVNLRQGHYSAATIVESLDQANVLKLNDEELAILCPLFGLSGSVEGILRGLAKRFELQLVALTRGSRGSLLATPLPRSEGRKGSPRR